MSTGSKKPNLASVTTVNKDGSHYRLHPADVKGRFTLARRLVAALCLIVYVALPWIKINGYPAVFLDTAMRRFHIFGVTLAIQDMWVLFFVITGLGFTLFFITSLMGRIWCGWTCPYTVFLEHVYRRIERWIDGDATARRKLDAAPWSGTKIAKRTLKHGLFLIISCLIAHVLVSYFMSLEGLYAAIQTGPGDHIFSFGVIIFFTVVLYGCFAFFREQFCIMMCPYGRLQSALSDDDTMIIGYDFQRGDPPGKPKDPDAGDCIDCRRCVQVCPTGIDIRNGLQLECIGCANCIDACDDIMTKLQRPTGLVRYDSYNGLHGKRNRILRPRLFMYFALMLVGLSVLTFTVSKKARPFTAQITKMKGIAYQQDDTGIRNVLRIYLFNKRAVDASYSFRVENAPEWLKISGSTDDLKLKPLGETTYTLVVIAPEENYDGPFDFTLIVEDQGGATVQQQVNFLGPNPRLYRKRLDEAKATGTNN